MMTVDYEKMTKNQSGNSLSFLRNIIKLGGNPFVERETLINIRISLMNQVVRFIERVTIFSFSFSTYILLLNHANLFSTYQPSNTMFIVSTYSSKQKTYRGRWYNLTGDDSNEL